jgi:hypothetical protein
MEVTSVYEWAAYDDGIVTAFVVLNDTLTYVTMFRKLGTVDGLEAYKIREGTMMANMDAWTKRYKPAIKKLLKSGVTEASEIGPQVFVSEAQMRWFLDGYYGGEIYIKTLPDGTEVEHVRLA